MLSLAVDVRKRLATCDTLTCDAFMGEIGGKLNYLKTSRPTAVNLFEACDRLQQLLSAQTFSTASDLCRECVRFAEELLETDVQMNKKIGMFGAKWLLENTRVQPSDISVLTHCNTGSLATAGYGTALGIVRALNDLKTLKQVYCTETRPYNQGSRLTAYELVVDQLPEATLICDSMAAFLFASKKKQNAPIAAVIVGADRVAANGDTANKVGTYQLALVARAHGVKFMVAAPSTSIDLSIKNGDQIVIEERPAEEMTSVQGCLKSDDSLKMERVHVAAAGINVWNPAFGTKFSVFDCAIYLSILDVTPADLIDAIVTEKGVAVKDHDAIDFDLCTFLNQA